MLPFLLCNISDYSFIFTQYFALKNAEIAVPRFCSVFASIFKHKENCPYILYTFTAKAQKLPAGVKDFQLYSVFWPLHNAHIEMCNWKSWAPGNGVPEVSVLLHILYDGNESLLNCWTCWPGTRGERRKCGWMTTRSTTTPLFLSLKQFPSASKSLL